PLLACLSRGRWRACLAVRTPPAARRRRRPLLIPHGGDSFLSRLTGVKVPGVVGGAETNFFRASRYPKGPWESSFPHPSHTPSPSPGGRETNHHDSVSDRSSSPHQGWPKRRLNWPLSRPSTAPSPSKSKYHR